MKKAVVEIREELKKLHGQRRRFKAKVERFGTRQAYNNTIGKPIIQTTVLLLRVIDAATGKEVADHVWMTVGKRLEGLTEGAEVAFNARVTAYRKFHRDPDGCRENNFHYLDYRLSYPTNVNIIKVTNALNATNDTNVTNVTSAEPFFPAEADDKMLQQTSLQDF